MKRTAIPIPTLIKFPQSSARQDAWGRLTRLTAGGAELSTAVRLLKDEWAALSFEIGNQKFDGLRAIVTHAADDDDGHRVVEFRFVDEVQRRSLAKALTEVLARS